MNVSAPERKNLRLLGFTNFYPPLARGGYGEICADVMAGLAARGHDVTVLAHAGESGRGVRVRAELDYVLAAWRHPARGLRAAANDRRVAESALAGGVDAALVWHMRGLAKAPLRLLHEAGIPVLYFLPDRWVLYERPGSLLIPWAQLDRLGFGHLRAWAPPIESDGIVCFVSEWLRKEYARRGWRPRHAEIVRCGIDVARFRSGRPALPSSPPRSALFAGRIHPMKGLEVAVEALASVQGLTLTVVGPKDDPKYEARVRAIARERGVEGRIGWRGEVARDEVVGLLGTHDVLLYPSVGVEAYSLGLLEGLAAGILVVTSAQGGPEEYLRDGDNALLFPPGDAHALVDRLERLRDPAVVETLVRGTGRTASEISLETVLDQVEALLASAPAGRGSP